MSSESRSSCGLSRLLTASIWSICHQPFRKHCYIASQMWRCKALQKVTTSWPSERTCGELRPKIRALLRFGLSWQTASSGRLPVVRDEPLYLMALVAPLGEYSRHRPMLLRKLSENSMQGRQPSRCDSSSWQGAGANSIFQVFGQDSENLFASLAGFLHLHNATSLFTVRKRSSNCLRTASRPRCSRVFTTSSVTSRICAVSFVDSSSTSLNRIRER